MWSSQYFLCHKSKANLLECPLTLSLCRILHFKCFLFLLIFLIRLHSSRCLATSTCLYGRATPGLCTKRPAGTPRNSPLKPVLEGSKSLHPSNTQYDIRQNKKPSHIQILSDTEIQFTKKVVVVSNLLCDHMSQNEG